MGGFFFLPRARIPEGRDGGRGKGELSQLILALALAEEILRTPCHLCPAALSPRPGREAMPAQDKPISQA